MDASLWGWAASLFLEMAHSQCSRVEAHCHLNYLELLVMFKALWGFESRLRGQSIVLRADNKTAVSYVNQQGGMVPCPLSIIALRMLSWAAIRDSHLSVVYVLGEQNLIVDALSKRVNAMAEAALSDLAFQQIMERDDFAAPSKAEVPHFISCVPTVGAVAADAFSLAWTLLGYLYLFLLLPLIPLVLGKLKRDRVSRAVMVVLVCCSKPWYAVLSQNTR
uniref:Reverse transcriptase RNase H-like domain-containing protein n=1 Tax=Latimeria chalumnae TaxID=7897 RepID=H3A3T3_LATCH